MWLKLSEGVYVPSSGLVGIFKPGAVMKTASVHEADETGLGGEEASRCGADAPDADNARAVVLMRDGTVIASPFGADVLARRMSKR